MVKTGCTLQFLTALSVGEVEFYAVVNGGAVGPSRAIYEDWRIHMVIHLLGDSLTA